VQGQAEQTTCPFIKLKYEPEKTGPAASGEHRCFKCRQPQPIKIAYQNWVCLTDRHVRCPVFDAAQQWKGELPDGARPGSEGKPLLPPRPASITEDDQLSLEIRHRIEVDEGDAAGEESLLQAEPVEIADVPEESLDDEEFVEVVVVEPDEMPPLEDGDLQEILLTEEEIQTPPFDEQEVYSIAGRAAEQAAQKALAELDSTAQDAIQRAVTEINQATQEALQGALADVKRTTDEGVQQAASSAERTAEETAQHVARTISEEALQSVQAVANTAAADSVAALVEQLKEDMSARVQDAATTAARETAHRAAIVVARRSATEMARQVAEQVASKVARKAAHDAINDVISEKGIMLEEPVKVAAPLPIELVEPVLDQAEPEEAELEPIPVPTGGELEVHFDDPEETSKGGEKPPRLWLWLVIGAVVIALIVGGIVSFPALFSASPLPPAEAPAPEAESVDEQPQGEAPVVEEAPQPADEPAVEDSSAEPAVEEAAEPTPLPADFTPVEVFVSLETSLRDGPGTQFGEIVKLDTGTRLSAIGRSADNEWILARTPFGEQGWVFAAQLTLDESDILSLPVAE